jgi:hypothetical protein
MAWKPGFQEVSMQKIKIIENVNLKDKRRSLVLVLLLGIIAVVGVAFSYQMTVSAGPKNTVRPALPESGSRNEKEAAGCSAVDEREFRDAGKGAGENLQRGDGKRQR